MTRPPFPKSIIGVFLLSLLYWLYLSQSTRMVIAADSTGYEALGRMIYSQGWVPFLTTGPNREPLYPLLIAASMHIGHFTGLAYVKIMAIFGVMLLLLTQIMTYKILRLLNTRNGICVLVLAYLALSPALNNAAFSLFSEIAVLPIILGIILSSARAWEAVSQNNKEQAIIYGALLGLLLMLATFVKGIFECVSPAFLAIFFTTIFFTDKTKKISTLALCLAAAASFYYVPVTDYKWLNKQFNGTFAITNRASWALYGDTAQRMEPLTVKRFAEALAYVPGEGVCKSIFGARECNFWSFQESDVLGLAKQNELSGQQLSPEGINSALVNASAQKAFQNPFQYTLLTFIEGLKMFFWESTKVGYVNYPPWLQKVYDIKILDNVLRFFASLMALIAVISLWAQSLRSPKSPIVLLIGLLVFLYILFFSFFCILTRYALPIAPLYLIAIGLWLNNLTSKKIN
jgi:hypothetical protein